MAKPEHEPTAQESSLEEGTVSDLEPKPQDSDGVKGGFNPQPDPPGRHKQ